MIVESFDDVDLIITEGQKEVTLNSVCLIFQTETNKIFTIQGGILKYGNGGLNYYFINWRCVF
jgi:hypothetical protein